jgi:CubicO group peptidase (beta-lactamase class C family)
MSGFDPVRLDWLRQVMADHVARDTVGGVAWLASRDEDVEVGVAGTLTRGESEPVRRDSIFRISSMTKPIVAAGALVLIEECRLRLEDPVDDLLPELANRRVLVDPRGPIDGDTVPADRPITVEDVLTFRLGLGMDFEAPWPQPLLEAMNGLGMGAGPPEPQVPPEPDEWLRRLATLPLLYQPGERWLYHIGSDVLGVLIARASGQSLDVFLQERVFEPLGMVDTGFATRHVDRLGSCYTRDPATGERVVYDTPQGQWAKPPAFPSGGAGLVSTVDDLHAFARLLLSGGQLPDGSRLLARASVEAMTSDHIGVDRGGAGASPDGSQGWGYGVGIQVRRAGLTRPAGSYGWAGGMGSSWANDPDRRLAGVLLTTDAFAGPFPPPAVIQDFWTCVYTALTD